MNGETPEHRSRVMRAVRSRDTTPEIVVRRAATALGYRYRLHKVELPGKPDLVFGRRRKVIFVHGCFWHGHDCPRGARTPKTNADYWRTKIGRNVARDQENVATLERAGWRVLTIWECSTRNSQRAALVETIESFLAS